METSKNFGDETISEIFQLPIKGTVYTYPHCGYSHGFHVSFDQQSDGIKIILISPNCHYLYDPRWNIIQNNEG